MPGNLLVSSRCSWHLFICACPKMRIWSVWISTILFVTWTVLWLGKYSTWNDPVLFRTTPGLGRPVYFKKCSIPLTNLTPGHGHWNGRPFGACPLVSACTILLDCPSDTLTQLVTPPLSNTDYGVGRNMFPVWDHCWNCSPCHPSSTSVALSIHLSLKDLLLKRTILRSF